jgi:hypothetical protein
VQPARASSIIESEDDDLGFDLFGYWLINYLIEFE